MRKKHERLLGGGGGGMGEAFDTGNMNSINLIPTFIIAYVSPK